VRFDAVLLRAVLFDAMCFDAVRRDAMLFDAVCFDAVLLDAVRRDVVLFVAVLGAELAVGAAVLFGAVLSAVASFEALAFDGFPIDASFLHTRFLNLVIFAITLCDEPLLALPAFADSPCLVPQPAAAMRRSAISAASRLALRARLADIKCPVMCALLAMGSIRRYRQESAAA
jgi:hypothetical protein